MNGARGGEGLSYIRTYIRSSLELLLELALARREHLPEAVFYTLSRPPKA